MTACGWAACKWTWTTRPWRRGWRPCGPSTSAAACWSAASGRSTASRPLPPTGGGGGWRAACCWRRRRWRWRRARRGSSSSRPRWAGPASPGAMRGALLARVWSRTQFGRAWQVHAAAWLTGAVAAVVPPRGLGRARVGRRPGRRTRLGRPRRDRTGTRVAPGGRRRPPAHVSPVWPAGLVPFALVLRGLARSADPGWAAEASRLARRFFRRQPRGRRPADGDRPGRRLLPARVCRCPVRHGVRPRPAGQTGVVRRDGRDRRGEPVGAQANPARRRGNAAAHDQRRRSRWCSAAAWSPPSACSGCWSRPGRSPRGGRFAQRGGHVTSTALSPGFAGG